MVIYWWILIYTSAVSFFGTSVNRKNLLEEKCNQNKDVSLFIAILTFALLIFFVGSRSEFNDTYYYRELYKGYITTDLSQILKILKGTGKSKYFNSLQVLFKHFISQDYEYWFFALAIFEVGAVIKLYYRYSTDFFFSSYLFIASTSFLWLMSGTRQFFAVAIVLYGINNLVERKLIKFMFLVLFASLFHISALIWIPVYFFCNSEPWKWRMLLFVACAAIVLFSLSTFTNILEDVLEDTNYSGITSNFDSTNGVSAMRFYVSCVPWFLAFIFRKQIYEENNKFINICINLSVISSVIYFLGMFTSGIIVGRLPMYFMLTNYILIPWILNKYLFSSTKFLLKLLCIILYFVYFYYDMVIKGTGHYGSELLNIPYV